MHDAQADPETPSEAAVASDAEWRGRPVLSALLRVAILCAPILASVAVTTLLTRLLPSPTPRSHLVVWFLGIILVAAAVFFGAQRPLRGLLPLATLLSLPLVFPGAAPTRLAVARRARRVRHLEAAVTRGESLGSSPADAAATVLALVTARTSRDRDARGRSDRIRVFTEMLGVELRLSRQERGKLRWAVLVHDVGGLPVPAQRLDEPGGSDAEEWEAIRAHPERGARMIAPLVAWLGPWAHAVDQHHETFNGTGYPHRLVGTRISLAGRIVAVADAYDAMTAPRPGERAMSISAAREELLRSSGRYFDPAVVRAFLNISAGRLRRTVGVAAWVGQVPVGVRILNGAGRLGGTTGQIGAALVATLGLVAGVAAGPHLRTVRASAAAPRAQSAPVTAAPSPSLAPAASSAPTGAPPAPSAAQPSAPPSHALAVLAPARAWPRLAPITITMLPIDLAPVVTMPATTTSGDGGDLSGVSGSFADADSTSWTATVDYGDGTGVHPIALSGTTFTLQHTYAAGEGATQGVTVRVRDNQGAVGVATATNTVVDTSPVPAVADAILAATGTYTATGSFADPGADAGDTYSATVDYGDNTPVENLVLTGKTFSLSHHYGRSTTPYKLVVTVTDSGGAHGDGTASITAT